MWEFKFKRKPKPEFKEKAAYVPQTQEHAPGLPKLTLPPYGNAAAQQNVGMCADIGGWQSYRVHQGATLPCTPGINRQFFQYGKLSGLDDE